MKRIFCRDGFRDGGKPWQMWHEGYEDEDDFVRDRNEFMAAEAARLEAAKPKKKRIGRKVVKKDKPEAKPNRKVVKRKAA